MVKTFTGERVGQFSQLSLQEITDGGSTRLRDPLGLFLNRDEAKQVFDSASDLPPSCQAAAAFLVSELLGYLPDQDIPLGNLVTLMQWVTGNFRTLTRQFHKFELSGFRFERGPSEGQVSKHQPRGWEAPALSDFQRVRQCL